MIKEIREIRGNCEDSFARNLLSELSTQYFADSIYIDAIDSNILLKFAYTTDIVIIMIRDQFVFAPEYNYWGNNINTTINNFEILANKWKNKKFLILCEFEGVSSSVNNLFFVNIGGKVVDDINYKTISDIEKNFDSTVVGVSLNRQMRPHRIALVSLLYGLGLEKYINVSAIHLHKQFVKIDDSDIMNHLSWKFLPNHEFVKKIMSNGFEKIYNNKELFNVGYDIYKMNNGVCVYLNNVDNFNDRLKSIYANSFVEIISESWFLEPYPFLTEKYLNSIYGKNFPICVSSKNYIKYVRNIGFDVFDDVVDHGYDDIEDPIIRLKTAILDNKHLFLNADSTKNLWKKNLSRFNKNIEFAKETMYNVMFNRTMSQCQEYLTNQT